MDALALAAELRKAAEGLRLFPYPDAGSALGKVTARLYYGKESWGNVPARQVMARLAPFVRALDGKPWTCGWGQTGKHIGPDSVPWTRSIADANLQASLETFQAGVRRLVRRKLLPHQEAALISFAYNCGLDEDEDKIAEGLGDSTLLRLVNAGRFDDASHEFKKWNKSGGLVMGGLVTARENERVMFLGYHPLLRAAQ